MADLKNRIAPANGAGRKRPRRTRSLKFRLGLGICCLFAAEALLVGGFFSGGPWPAPAAIGWWAAILVLALLGSWRLARSATRPLELAQAALQELSEDKLSERLFYPEADDEEGRVFASLNQLLDRVEEAMERQRRFVGSITHDIRTPLTIIRGDTEVALMQERTARSYREVLESNLEEVERIGKLVEDLLTLSRGHRGDLSLRVKAVPLDMLLREVRRQYQEAASAKGVTLGLYLEGEVEIEGDRDRLRQVLTNLVENALHYTPAGGKVDLSLFQDENVARIIVRDTGVGIEEKDLPHIFEPFYRGAEQGSHQGYGLGLAICQHIVQAHGGKIWVESQVGPDSGTTFFVGLPLQPSARATSRVLAP